MKIWNTAGFAQPAPIYFPSGVWWGVVDEFEFAAAVLSIAAHDGILFYFPSNFFNFFNFTFIVIVSAPRLRAEIPIRLRFQYVAGLDRLNK